jgi:hypothetical protein
MGEAQLTEPMVTNSVIGSGGEAVASDCCVHSTLEDI